MTLYDATSGLMGIRIKLKECQELSGCYEMIVGQCTTGRRTKVKLGCWDVG